MAVEREWTSSADWTSNRLEITRNVATLMETLRSSTALSGSPMSFHFRLTLFEIIAGRPVGKRSGGHANYRHKRQDLESASDFESQS